MTWLIGSDKAVTLLQFSIGTGNMNAAPNPNLYKLDRQLTLPQVVQELAAMPGRLRRTVAGAPHQALLRAPAADGWSAFQTVCHFRDAALVYAGRFRFIVFNQDPFLPDYDENNWVASSNDRVEDMAAILDEIASSRSDLVRVLSRLSDGGWRRAGRHEAMGPVVLEDYARHQVAHEEMHLAQISRALA